MCAYTVFVEIREELFLKIYMKWAFREKKNHTYMSMYPIVTLTFPIFKNNRNVVKYAIKKLSPIPLIKSRI